MADCCSDVDAAGNFSEASCASCADGGAVRSMHQGVATLAAHDGESEAARAATMARAGANPNQGIMRRTYSK
eukprot:444077-Prymnesium_polylepis.1